MFLFPLLPGLGAATEWFSMPSKEQQTLNKKRINPLKKMSLLGNKSSDVLLSIAGLRMSYSSITIGPTVLRFCTNWILHSSIDQYWHWTSYFEINYIYLLWSWRHFLGLASWVLQIHIYFYSSLFPMWLLIKFSSQSHVAHYIFFCYSGCEIKMVTTEIQMKMLKMIS